MFLQLSFDKKILCACGVLALPVVLKFLSFTFGSRQAVDVAHLNNRIYELQNEIRSLQNSVDVIIALLKEHNAEEHIPE